MERMILVPGRNCPANIPAVLRFSANPEEIELSHDAGLTPRPAPLFLDRTAPAPAMAYGGPAETTLSLSMVFEASGDADVRAQTHWLYLLAQMRGAGLTAPCEVDLIWGKTWAYRGTIRTLEERLDLFSASGTATRAWVRLTLTGMSLTTTGTGWVAGLGTAAATSVP